MSSYAERVSEAHRRYRAAIGTKDEALAYVNLVCVVRFEPLSPRNENAKGGFDG